MKTKIIVAGSINMDLVTRAAIPRPGETVIGGDLQAFPGGKGANQAVAAARMGGQVSMIGRVGEDAFGAQMRAALEKDAVDTTFVLPTAGTPTGVALIVVDERGQNSIVVTPGANGRLAPSDIDTAADAIAAVDVLLLQLEISLETVQRAAELAAQHGLKVILNPAPAAPLPQDLLSKVDILIPNEIEAAALSGMPTGNTAELEAAAGQLLEQGVGAVILTLGERGALLVDGQSKTLRPAFGVKEVVDTTAAGDAFAGALAVAVGEGLPLPEAISWATAAGALAVTKSGAQPSLPTRAEVLDLLAGFAWSR
jgi:ribokinase